jgi:raffinose/stachyose/melibiose transport system permease protein
VAKVNTRKFRDFFHSIFFISPAYILFAIALIIPFFLSFYYSLTNWDGFSSNVRFVGMDNFIRIITEDNRFASSFWFTTRFTLVCVVLTNVIGLALALALTTSIRSRNWLRTIFFMPNLLGGVLLGFIWQFIFTNSFVSIGSITQISALSTPWLGDSNTAFWGNVIVFVWQASGYLMVIYIAAIQSVDRSLQESAQIDGANGTQVLRKIILPLIAPAFTICLFLSLAWGFKSFDTIFALTQGGPFNSTESVTINIYREAFGMNNAGVGTAKALIFFVLIASISLIQVAITKKREVHM